jgi:hypothetical protein
MKAYENNQNLFKIINYIKNMKMQKKNISLALYDIENISSNIT